jgi:hypothetical protein
MEEAIIGLVGVVVGALITAGTQVLTRRSERRAERQHAVRVVASELALFAAALTAQPLQPERIRASASSTLETWRVHRLALTWLRRRLVANGPEGPTPSGSPASGAAAADILEQLKEYQAAGTASTSTGCSASWPSGRPSATRSWRASRSCACLFYRGVALISEFGLTAEQRKALFAWPV